jgi:chromosome partitioning protein
MTVIVIANPKGGAGKSTLASNVAGLLAREGLSVMLGDVDRQQSARQWLALRPPDMPLIQSWDLDKQQIARPPKGTTHVVLDTPAGLSGKTLDAVLKIADKLIVPLQASLFDIQATHVFVKQLLAHVQAHPKTPALAIGMVAMRVRETTLANDRLHEYLAMLPVPLITNLRDTQNYVHVAAHGLTLWDVTPSRVERDLQQWQALKEWILR